MILGIRGWNIEFILRQIHNDVAILLPTNCDRKSACQRAISWARQSSGSLKLNVDGSCLDQDLHSRAELMSIRHGLALTGDSGQVFEWCTVIMTLLME
ncbi:hypothetical protein RIF29_28439 [Crotalaria pallida]|uniref:Uncharacterized protein n=1 Tax=Crotalaria pallida TaxID=3830 RepID=A0AAN9HV18_CROPI